MTWQRIACATVKARRVGRARLADLLGEAVANYRERGEPVTVAYGEVEDALLDNPDLTLAQVRRWLARLYGLRFGKVEQVFRRLRRVYEEARREELEARRLRRQVEREWLSSPKPRNQEASGGRDG